MSSTSQDRCCIEIDRVSAFALGVLDTGDLAGVEAHLAACSDCRDEVAAMKRVFGAFAHWPTDLLRPSPSMWERLAGRIAAGADRESTAVPSRRGPQPKWEEVAPGISYKLLAADTEGDRISLLVRLAPGAEYPSHRHAGVEEVHLLHGELWIDGRKLDAGDYRRSEPGTTDRRVWSETGCTCLLVTSSRDVLR